ncbi:MAG TPA: hypothetical protein DCQ64_26155 [Candidatus Rokubacteria bacterium]|nr:hypothetical protein [Candidatus Rokubacteria bacterium]
MDQTMLTVSVFAPVEGGYRVVFSAFEVDARDERLVARAIDEAMQALRSTPAAMLIARRHDPR